MNFEELMSNYRVATQNAEFAFLNELGRWLYQPDGKLVVDPEQNNEYYRRTGLLRIAVYNQTLDMFAKPSYTMNGQQMTNVNILFRILGLNYRVHRVVSHPVYDHSKAISFKNEVTASVYGVGERQMHIHLNDAACPENRDRDSVLSKLTQFAKKTHGAINTARNKEKRTLDEANARKVLLDADLTKQLEEFNKRYNYR